MILTQLVERYGWDEMGRIIRTRYFQAGGFRSSFKGVIVPIHLSKWYNLSMRVTAKTSYFLIDTQETKRVKILMFSMFVMKQI